MGFRLKGWAVGYGYWTLQHYPPWLWGLDKVGQSNPESRVQKCQKNIPVSNLRTWPACLPIAIFNGLVLHSALATHRSTQNKATYSSWNADANAMCMSMEALIWSGWLQLQRPRLKTGYRPIVPSLHLSSCRASFFPTLFSRGCNTQEPWRQAPGKCLKRR